MTQRVFERRAAHHPSRVVTEAEFSELYAACEFAAQFGMHLDTPVLVAWKLLGRESDEEVQAGFMALTKCLRDWLAERHLPCAFIDGHERGARVGLHTHLNIYIPGRHPEERAETPRRSAPSLRRDFRRYLQDWAKRHFGGPSPRAVRVRRPSVETPWLTWALMNYIVKGYGEGHSVSARRIASRMVVSIMSVTWKYDGSPVAAS